MQEWEAALDWSKSGGVELATVLTVLKTDDSNSPVTPNDNDGFVHWNNLEGMPTGVLDGDDDGASRVNQLKNDLAASDSVPNENTDLVSFNEVKDLTEGGDGRIDGTFIKDGSIQAGDLAGSYSFTGPEAAVESVVGAVNSSKIADGTIESRDLSDGSVTADKLHQDLVDRLEALEEALAAQAP